MEQELPTLPEHLGSPPVFSGVCVTRSLVLCVCFVDRCLSFCTFSFDDLVLRSTASDYLSSLNISWSRDVLFYRRCVSLCFPLYFVVPVWVWQRYKKGGGWGDPILIRRMVVQCNQPEQIPKLRTLSLLIYNLQTMYYLYTWNWDVNRYVKYCG